MANNLYQIQPLKIDYTNLPEGIDKEELEQAAASGQQRNRLFQLITRAGDAIQPAKSALEKVIFGAEEQPKITTAADGTKAVTVNNNRAGGLLGFANDVAKGYQENVSTPYNSENLLPAKKSFGQRFGEGLGTATRLLDNSAVRGLLAYGLSKSLGDNNALEQGLTAASMNMAAKNNDKLYRNDLEKMGVDTSGIGGYINEDTYKNILASRQMQENAEWRKAQMEMTRQQNEIMNDIRRQQVAQGWANLLNKTNKNTGNIGNLQAITDQLNRFSATFKDMPNKLESNTLGRLRNATGFQTETEANFNSQRTLLFNKIARDLGGEKGVLSDQDINRIEKSLPNYTDSYAQKQAKMAAIYDLLQDRLSVEGASLNNLSVAQAKTNDLPNVETTTIRVKSPNGKIGTIPATQLEDALAAGYTRL